MREFLSDRNFIIAKIEFGLKILLGFALVIFFLPLIVLPFFNHASADDYYGLSFYKHGFLQYQYYIYNNWSGRFSAIFFASFFLRNGFLYDHYYLHSLLLLLLNFIATFLLFKLLNKYVLKKHLSKGVPLLCAFIFTALTILCSPETSSLLFWFSSTFVYYAGLIFLQLSILFFVLLLYSSNNIVRTICYIFLPLLVFVINGFSEVFVVMQLCLFVLLYYAGFRKRTSSLFFIVLIIFFTGSAVLSFAAPGNYIRAQAIPALQLKNGIVAIAFSAAEVMATIFKNPLAWFATAVIFITGCRNKEMVSKHFKQKALCYLMIVCLLFFVFLLMAVIVGVIGLKGRIVPDRFLNMVCWFSLLLIFAAAYIGGISTKNNLFVFRFYKRELTAACYLILIVCLCCNNYISDAYKSMLSAPLYNTIITEQENIFKDASKNKTVAIVKTYDAALKELMQKKFPDASATYIKWAQQKPALIYNNNGDSDEQSILVLKKFYGVDSVVIKK